MRRFRPMLIFLFTVMAISFAVDRAVGYVVEAKLLPIQKDKYMYAFHGGNCEDIAVFGASRASYHYIPQMFEDSLGLTCFNYGCDAQNIYNQYALLNLLLNHCRKKPKIILLELSRIDVQDTPQWNTEKLTELYPYCDLDDSVKSVVALKGKACEYALRASKLYKFNSQIHNFLKPAVGIKYDKSENKGYLPLYETWDEPLDSIYIEETAVDPLKVRYLKSFIQKCKENDIRLILLNSPHYIIMTSHRNWCDTVREIAHEYSVPFYDFEFDDRFLKHPEWFRDTYHLNHSGAEIFTSLIFPLLSYLLPLSEADRQIYTRSACAMIPNC